MSRRAPPGSHSVNAARAKRLPDSGARRDTVLALHSIGNEPILARPTTMQSHSHSLLRHGSLASAKKFAAATIFAGLILPGAAQAKSLVDYFQPTPLACPPTTNTWGASTSVPRDTCNGLEDTKKPPQWVYWDGRILKAPDGKYHLLGSRWAGAAGHGGWYSSVAIHAVSDSSPLGPYVDKGVAYTNGPDGGDRSKGHNVSAYELLDGTYALIVSETVPFTIFTAKSLDGPWTNKGHAQIDRNNVQINIPFPGDQNLESNVTESSRSARRGSRARTRFKSRRPSTRRTKRRRPTYPPSIRIERSTSTRFSLRRPRACMCMPRMR